MKSQFNFENKNYVSYPRNADLDDLPIKKEQRLITKKIECFTNNAVGLLEISYIEQSFDNRIYESNSQNENL